MNPNELRALVAIVQAIATRRKEEEGVGNEERSVTRTSLYLPDCDSFLRSSTLLIANNDEWLSSRAAKRVKGAGLFYLHPSISLCTSTSLGVPNITDVFVEKLSLPILPSEWGDDDGKYVRVSDRC